MPRKPRSPLWTNRDFLLLWSGQTVSAVGSEVTTLAFPLIAVTTLHASPFEVGLLTALERLPFLVVALFAGVIVDRVRRRRVLIGCDVGRALLLASIPLAAILAHVTYVQLLLTAMAVGTFTVFFDVAYQAYLPVLVERELVPDGNAKLEVTNSAAVVAGPGLAGVLVQFLQATKAVAVDAASFVVSVASLILIRRPEPPVPVEERAPMRAAMLEGVRYVFTHPWLRPIALSTGTGNFFTSMMQAVLIVYMVRGLHFSAGLIGAIFAIGNLGFVMGAALTPRIGDRFGPGITIVASAVIGGAGSLLIAAVPRHGATAVLIAGTIVASLATPIYNITQLSLRQMITPQRMLGRMNATMRWIVWGTIPLGAIIGGVLGSTVGLRETLWISGVAAFFWFLPVMLSPVRTIKSIDQARA